MTAFSFQKRWFYGAVNSLIACLLLFMMLPVPAAGAESDNTTAVELPVSDNQTEVPVFEADNLTEVAPVPAGNMTVMASPRVNSRILAEPDKAVELRSTNGRILLEIPEGAVPEPVAIEMSVFGPVASTGMKILNLFELNAYPVDTESLRQNGEYEKFASGNISDEAYSRYVNQEREITTFNQPLLLTVSHDENDMRGLDPDSLHLYYLDEETRTWQVAEFSIYYSADFSLTAPIEHFSYYGEQANPLEVGPGKVMAAQVNLHSGAAMYRYPLELPPGPGGFTPALTLTYNSGSVDEMKNKQDVGSWVGIGWSLGFGKISMSLATEEYSLDLNGSSYELVTSDDVNYKTNPDQHLKITRSGNTWTVLDTDGTSYRFGGTNDSQQYVNVATYYRWDLSLITDTNGNQATISYVQDVHNSTVRSAYPETLEYGNVEVHFTSSWDETDGTDGYLRYDNPKSTVYNPSPKIMENKQLDSIEIEVSDTLVREYNFGYTTTERSYSAEYSGIYYAGQHKLDSIMQVGADSSSTLPAISFIYNNLNIYYNNSYTQVYSGNPGNPVSLTRPFITAVNSGYGGSISFSYTQNPSTPVQNIWTREVVTTKTVNGGITGNEVYSYTYTGNPQYHGVDWEEKFRGWNEVTETDTASNYVKHWFYTTGNFDGKDAERLTGREYKTQWYDSGDNLVKEQLYTWSWDYTTPICPGMLSGWDNRIKIVIDSSKISEDLSYFPVLIHLSDDCTEDKADHSYIFSEIGDSYTSIAVTEDDGQTQLYVEVESWDSSLGEAWLWVSGENWEIDDSEDTVLYLYYDIDQTNSSYVGVPGSVVAQNVWDDYFCAVYHLSETNGNALDSTGNDNDGSVYGATAGQTGKVGDSYSFGGDGDYIDYGNDASLNPAAALSVEAYLNFNNAPDMQTVLGKYGTVLMSNGIYTWYAPRGWYLDACNNYLQFVVMTQYTYVGFSAAAPLPNGTWQYIAGVFDGSRMLLYHNGESKGSCEQYPYILYDNTPNLTAAIKYGGATLLNGSMDEIRLSSIGRSAAWINATYSTCTDVLTHVTYDPGVISLDQIEEVTYGAGGNKITRTRYEYDEYGNVITEFVDGDTSTNADDATVWRLYYPNTTDNIMNRVARERVYATAMATDSGGANLKAETMYYYDGNNASLSTPPTVGNLTRVESKKDSGNSVSSWYTYDGYGNRLTEVDPNSNTTIWTYEATHHTYPATKTYPIAGLSESYTYDPGTNNLLTMTDVNGQTISYQYDTFKRLTKVIKPGDSSESPTVQYLYNSWGTINSQNIEIRSKTTGGDYLWQKDYFDGLGRVIQTHNEGEAGHTIVSGTTVYNTRGLADKQYVSQDVASVLGTYQAPSGQYTGYTYDALGRVTTQTNPDSTTIGRNYSYAWQELVTNQRGYKTRYCYDAFGNLVTVEELDAADQVYATTEYDYDTLGNLLEVEDEDGNTTTMTYDWLSRKTGMTDPDMGTWSYGYDSNGNLTSQTDAKSQAITFAYDYLNRLTGKTYPGGLGMTNVSYTYDSTSGGNYGKGLRTGMTDELGTVAYTYDTRGRLITEDRVASSVHYITQYTYDSADRIATITYPTGETVTQTYNCRGLPSMVAGSVAGNLVTSALYNGLGSVTEINFNNGLKTTYGYYQTGGAYDTGGNFFGKLYEIKTLPQGGGNALVDVVHTWDAGGNLATRQDVLASETETFGYDFLDRLTSVGGPYSYSYSYDEIGNLVTRNGVSYTYNSTQPHAVDAVGGTNYYYDNNGNMTTRVGQTITWDVENRPVSVSENGTTTTFVYDGDGNRVQKVEGGETILYVNRFYEKNLTTTVVTTSYYLGGTLVAQREDTTLRYAHQDHLSGTSLMTDTNGNSLGTMKYYPYGSTRSGSVPTDELFTGQKLDGTGLYYYGARYYDPVIGRFISPDTIVPDPSNPQHLNSYSYCYNNPLKYTDPSGHWGIFSAIGAIVGGIAGAVTYAITTPAEEKSAAGWVSSVLGGAVAGALTGGLSAFVKTAGIAATAVITGGLTPGIGAVGVGVRETTEWAMSEMGLGGYTPLTPLEAVAPAAGLVTGPFSSLFPSGVDIVAGIAMSSVYDVATNQVEDKATVMPVKQTSTTNKEYLDQSKRIINSVRSSHRNSTRNQVYSNSTGISYVQSGSDSYINCLSTAYLNN